jgi:hypothetical protein
LLSLLLWSALALSAAPMFGGGFAFTYQGRLTSDGTPLNGSYDLLFHLRGDADDAAILGTNQFAAVPVKQGLFTVSLDFGQDVFNGAARSLEIGVRSSEEPPADALQGGDDDGVPAPLAFHAAAVLPPGAFTMLSPVTAIGAAPASIVSYKSLLASSAASVAPGAVTPVALAGLASSARSGLVSVSGGVFSIAPSSGLWWDLKGNSGTAVNNFLGTTDNRPLELRVNSARALRLEPNLTSPNLIGGFSGNTVAPGIDGATIGGGGSSGNSNVVSANFATVSGGLANGATNTYAVVGGAYNVAGGYASAVAGGGGFELMKGLTNAALGHWSAIGGGRENTAGGKSATIAGGERNDTGGDWDAIGGGVGHTAAGMGATVGGGGYNAASFDWATVSGGRENAAQALDSTVGGGVGNYAQPPAIAATIAGGANNVATGTYSTIPGGREAKASQSGQMAQANGYFAQPGDAQTSVYVLRNQTDSLNPSRLLFLDGTGTPLRVELNRTMTFDILVTARNLPDPGPPPIPPQSAGYAMRGVVKNDLGTAQFVGLPTVTVLGEDDANWNATVMTLGDALVIQVTSGGANPVPSIHWVARVQTAETAW